MELLIFLSYNHFLYNNHKIVSVLLTTFFFCMVPLKNCYSFKVFVKLFSRHNFFQVGVSNSVELCHRFTLDAHVGQMENS